MIEAIVYQSNTGHSQRYAELLAQKIDLSCYPLDKSSAKLPKGTEVIYLGWIMAGTIKGYSKAGNYFAIRAVGAVGGNQPSDQNIDDLIEKNQIAKTPVFYLRGGFDLNKVKGPHGAILKQIGKSLIKAAEKSDAKEDIIEAAKSFKENEDFVSEANLADIISWYQKGL